MKFGIRSAVDVVFKTTRDYSGEGEDYLLKKGMKWSKGEPVLYFDSLKASTTEGTADSVYARGGQGNPKLIAWEGDKSVTFSFEDALISAEGMAILTGAELIDLSDDSGRTLRVRHKVVVNPTKDKKIDLKQYCKDGAVLVADEVFGFLVGADGEIIKRLGKATIDATSPGGTTIEFKEAASSITDKSSILLDFYTDRKSKVQEISIEPDKFAGYFYIEGDTLFRRQSNGKDLAAQIHIPNAKIQTAFNFSMSPSGDPSTFSFKADAFPGVLAGAQPGDPKKLYALRIIDEDV